MRALESRAIDLLVAQKFGSFADQSLDFDALYHESYVVLAGARSPWARRRNIKLSDLVDEAWTLSSPETVIGGVATEAFRASGLKPPRVAVTTFPPRGDDEPSCDRPFPDDFAYVCTEIFQRRDPSSKSCPFSCQLPRSRSESCR